MNADRTLPALVDARTGAQDALARIVRFLLFVSLAQAVVVPNSFQIVQLGSLVLTGALCVVLIRRDLWLNRVLLTLFAGAVVTAIYIWVGYSAGAPREASTQTLFVYVVAPFLWAIMGTALFQYVGIVRATRWLIWLTWAAIVSVALFFWAFLTFGRAAVVFLNPDANVNVSGGFAGASILVYGSLIFLAGALFAQPDLVRGRVARIVLPALVFLTALTSGRSALILAVPIGYGVGALLRSRMGQVEDAPAQRSVLLPTVLLGIGGLLVVAVIDFFVDSIDLWTIVERFWEELTSGGGSDRTEQSAALWEGFLDSWGVGVGHGIGVPYLRNAIFPWRYEVLPLATLLRVGVIGSVVYCSTFLIYGAGVWRRIVARDLSPQDVYMLGGFVPALLSIATNPYIESFVFQWMYFVPVMSLAVRPLERYARD